MSELHAGDRIRVRTGSVIPVDGEICEGEAYINESSMTGEPLAVMKSAGSSVFAGTVVEEGTVAITVRSLSSDTKISKIIELIDREIAAAECGEEAYIGLKLNSLTDKVLMDKLIEASCAGVKIEMVIRGISCLVAGVKDKTENITIRSIVGRYLEHSRIYIFGKGERRKVYISSADFMTRNTIRRIEVAAPINSPKIRSRILHIFDIMLRDNVKARIQNPDGTYSKVIPAEGEELINAQEYFIKEAAENANAAAVRKPIKVKVRRIR